MENFAKRMSLSSLLSVSASTAITEEDEDKESQKRPNSAITRSLPSANSACVEYLDEKQIELLKQLQDEIQTLRYENNELKFVLFVALKHVDAQSKTTNNGNEFQWEMEALARDYWEEINNTKNMQLELESATSMLEDAKWVQQHYEIRVREQELKIEELQKQLFELKANELTLMHLQISPTDYRSSRCCRRSGSESQSSRIKSNGKQRSVSTSGQQHRVSGSKRCTKALLPANYKDSVATLPPILSGQANNANETPFWIPRKNVA